MDRAKLVAMLEYRLSTFSDELDDFVSEFFANLMDLTNMEIIRKLLEKTLKSYLLVISLAVHPTTEKTQL